MPAWLPPSLSPSLPAYLPTYLSIFELKEGFLFYTCSNIFWLALNLYAFKANIKLLCHGIAESFFVYYIVHIIILYIIKAFRFFGASRQPPSTALLDPIWFSTSLSFTWLRVLELCPIIIDQMKNPHLQHCIFKNITAIPRLVLRPLIELTLKHCTNPRHLI